METGMQQTDGCISNLASRQVADGDNRRFSAASSIANDPKQLAALAVRARKEAARVAAAKAKAEKRDKKAAQKHAQKLAKEERKLRQAQEAEAEALELKADREAADKERRARLLREKEHEKQYREHRKQLERERQEEKDRQKALKSVAWGFDPSAGLRAKANSESNSQPTGSFVFDSKHTRRTAKASEQFSEVDGMGHRTGRRWHTGNTWGLEVGDAGKGFEQNYRSKKDKTPEV